MKKIMLLILVILFGFSGCSKGSTFSLFSFENNTSHKMSASYYFRSGTKEKVITVKDEAITINADIVTEEGSLDVFIYDENDQYIYEGYDLQSTSFSITLSNPGKYTIKVVADKHKGSYKFEW